MMSALWDAASCAVAGTGVLEVLTASTTRVMRSLQETDSFILVTVRTWNLKLCLCVSICTASHYATWKEVLAVSLWSRVYSPGALTAGGRLITSNLLSVGQSASEAWFRILPETSHKLITRNGANSVPGHILFIFTYHQLQFFLTTSFCTSSCLLVFARLFFW
jgi:hypothetical protein